MPTIASTDGTKLHYEEAGSGTPIVFVHEFAGDYRTWEPQLRYFARAHRCVAFSARGYPPSEVPSDPARYGQDIARSDVIAVMDGLGIKKAHVVGHSMGAYTALHVGIRHPERCISVTAAGCGWGSVADPAVREDMRKLARETAAMFTEKGMTEAAVIYSDTPTRQTQKYKDPRGYAEFARMLPEKAAATQQACAALLDGAWALQRDPGDYMIYIARTMTDGRPPSPSDVVELVERTSFHGAQIAATGIDAATALLAPFHECAMSNAQRLMRRKRQ